MALFAKIKSVSYTQAGTDSSGNPTTTDLSLTGELVVVADYADSGAPTTILATQRFQVPSTESEAQISARVVAYGAKVRDARTRVSQLQADVGVTIAIP